MHEVMEREKKGCALKKTRAEIFLIIFLTVISVTVMTGPCFSHAQSQLNEPQESSWYRFRDPGGRFQCEFPLAPTLIPVTSGTITSLAWGLRIDNDTACIVSTTDLGKTRIKDVQRGFDGAREVLLRNHGAHLIIEEQVQLGGVPGRSITARLGSGRTLRTRLYFKSGVLYQLIGISPPDVSENDTLRFFRSFMYIFNRQESENLSGT